MQEVAMTRYICASKQD